MHVVHIVFTIPLAQEYRSLPQVHLPEDEAASVVPHAITVSIAAPMKHAAAAQRYTSGAWVRMGVTEKGRKLGFPVPMLLGLMVR